MYVNLIMDLLEMYFLSLIFLSNMFCSSFFPKLRGRFTHGTVRANVFFSYNFNVFLKDLSFIKYLNKITQEWGVKNLSRLAIKQ